jgi:hypothetical protein
MNFLKANKVHSRDEAERAWLQKQIEDESATVALGDLLVIRREIQQSSEGKLY